MSDMHKRAELYQNRIDKMNIPKNIQEERERKAMNLFIKAM